jgi:hypothetical protein
VDAAAALALVRGGLIALSALRAGRVAQGESVLITAAASGTGHLAADLAAGEQLVVVLLLGLADSHRAQTIPTRTSDLMARRSSIARPGRGRAAAPADIAEERLREGRLPVRDPDDADNRVGPGVFCPEREG